MIIAVDLFCGLGGASAGIRAVHPDAEILGIERDAGRARQHEASGVGGRVLCASVEDSSVRSEVSRMHPKIDLLWASPPCTDFSRAKAGKIRSETTKDLSLTVADWARDLDPALIVVENVPEFAKSPQCAQLFARLSCLGYFCHLATLDASDYGAATSRLRVYLIASRGLIRIPRPTHGRSGIPKRTALDVVDLSDLGETVASRRLAEKTLSRIAAGLNRHGQGQFLATVGYGEKEGERARTRPLTLPLPTIVRSSATLTLVSFIVKYYNTSTFSAIDSPLPTATTRERFALASAVEAPQSWDQVHFRMLRPRELARAQGFADDFVLTGSHRDQIAGIGNSVCPPVAAAILRANPLSGDRSAG